MLAKELNSMSYCENCFSHDWAPNSSSECREVGVSGSQSTIDSWIGLILSNFPKNKLHWNSGEKENLIQKNLMSFSDRNTV